MRKKRVISAIISIIYITLLTSMSYGCQSSLSQKGTNKVVQPVISQKSSQRTNQLHNLEDNKNKIISVSNDYINYNMYNFKSIDLFLIAVALHDDFKGEYDLPNTDMRELYKKAKDFFMPYKSLDFVKNLGKYMDGDDVNTDYLGILLCNTDLPQIKKQYNYGKYNKDKNAQEFVNGLQKFYKDTKAEEFFKTSDEYYDKLKQYIEAKYDKNEIAGLITDVLKYTNNKEKYYGSNIIIYNTVISLYRSKGSFFVVNENGKINFISIQYGYAYTKDKNDDFDAENIITTSIHEYLHNFVNQPVANNMKLINQLTKGKSKMNYTSKIYYNFPWNRVTDECFVRAIEARIFKNRFGEEKAIKVILNPETKNGFSKLKDVYNKLQQYENNRNKYKTIDDFMPELIKEMYNK